jgi:hypothetical protein
MTRRGVGWQIDDFHQSVRLDSAASTRGRLGHDDSITSFAFICVFLCSSALKFFISTHWVIDRRPFYVALLLDAELPYPIWPRKDFKRK